jgi:hypothetical protein
VIDGKAILRPRVKDANDGQKLGRELEDFGPGTSITLAAPPKRSSPEFEYTLPKYSQTSRVGGDSVVRKIPSHHLTQPPSLLLKRLVQTTPQFLFDGFQSSAHPISPRLAVEKEMTRTRASTNVGKAKKVECFRFSKPPSCSTLSRETTELDNTSLLRMQRQSELLHSFVQILKKTPGLVFVLKSGDAVVGVSHKHDLSESVTVSPPISPKVEAVMKVDVGEHRRNHRSLWASNRAR